MTASKRSYRRRWPLARARRAGLEEQDPLASGRSGRKGFALLIVLWGLGLISLLVASFAASSRLRLRSASDLAGAARAQLACEGAIDVAILALVSESSAGETTALHDGAPSFCMVAGAAIAVTIEDEGGKVDINNAPSDLLEAMLIGLGTEPRRADLAANAIIDFRTAPTREVGLAAPSAGAADKPFPPKHGPFDSVLELDQVATIDPSLFQDMLPFVTVDRRGLSSAHRLKQGIDPRVAPPALFAALAGFSPIDVRASRDAPFPNRLDRNDPRLRPAFKSVSERASFLIRAESLLSTGGAAVRESLVDLHADSGSQRFVVRESRIGATRYVERLRLMIENGAEELASCWPR